MSRKKYKKIIRPSTIISICIMGISTLIFLYYIIIKSKNIQDLPKNIINDDNTGKEIVGVDSETLSGKVGNTYQT